MHNLLVVVAIHEVKVKNTDCVEIGQRQIAFSRPGLNAVDLTGKRGDDLHARQQVVS